MADLYNANVLADSLSPRGYRLTTMEVTLPRPYLAEFNTHRKFSRNSASTRAIPTEKQIERALNTPYIPEFYERVPGMGYGVPLTGYRRTTAQGEWLKARDNAVASAQKLLNVSKDIAGRLLEPFMWQTIIVTSTEWDNFLALRRDEGAAPAMQRTAGLMAQALRESDPVALDVGEWHLPLFYVEDEVAIRYSSDPHAPALVSAGRCARVSYDRQHDTESPRASMLRAQKLLHSFHWSPTEHQAQLAETMREAWDYNGNLDGDWMQFRKMHPNEHNAALLMEVDPYA